MASWPACNTSERGMAVAQGALLGMALWALCRLLRPSGEMQPKRETSNWCTCSRKKQLVAQGVAHREASSTQSGSSKWTGPPEPLSTHS
eukprot:891390-Pelagomonas_calceolata.AAC.1